jgi:plastocyanin
MSPIHNSRRAFAIVLTIGALALLALSFACGGGDDKATTGATTAAATSPAASTSPKPQSFDIKMTEEAYEPNNFTVARGAQVTLNLTNAGTSIHNVRIAGEDDKYNTADDVVSDPDLITGGNTGTVKWTAPNKAGEYKYQCDIHPNLGGIITVQ